MSEPTAPMSIDDILDWQARAAVEAAIRSIAYGEDLKIVVTQELIDKHRAEAKAAIKAYIGELIGEDEPTVFKLPLKNKTGVLNDPAAHSRNLLRQSLRQKAGL